MSSRLALAAALALSLAACKSKEERASERLMPAVTALGARLPAADPKEFVRTAVGYADTLAGLEETVRGLERPPPGTPAAAKLAPVEPWIEAAKAEHGALEKGFREALGRLEQDAHGDLGKVLFGADTKPLDQLATALAPYGERPIVLWRGTGERGGFDLDYQHLPAARRATDPGARYLVGYVQRIDGEGVTYVQEKVTAERKAVLIALYELPTRRRLGVYRIDGETAKLPTPLPLPGTVLPGEKPPLVEALLKKP